MVKTVRCGVRPRQHLAHQDSSLAQTMWRMVLAYAGDPSDDTEQPLLEWSIPDCAGKRRETKSNWYEARESSVTHERTSGVGT